MGDPPEERPEEIPMSPEEQEMFDRAVTKAKAIFSEQHHPGDQELQADQDSQQRIGNGVGSDPDGDPEAGPGVA